MTFTVSEDDPGVAPGIFNMVRFIVASLGSTACGAFLDGTGGGYAGFRLCCGVRTAVALAEVILALSVPAANKTAPRRPGKCDDRKPRPEVRKRDG